MKISREGPWFLKMSVTQLPAWRKLQKLSSTPPDLRNTAFLTPERIEDFSLEACSWRLVYAMQRLDEEVLSCLEELAEQRSVMGQMRAMQEGAILNRIEGYPSEERAVLHTAMRSFIGREPSTPLEKEAACEWEKLKAFLVDVEKEGHWKHCIVVGIGGSELGPRAIYTALKPFRQEERKAFFIANVDPDNAMEVLQEADLPHSLVLVVSKSGTTMETSRNEAFVRRFFEEKGLPSQRHFVAITGKGSCLDDPERYRERFFLWDSIGGRYSVTSMVGVVLLAFVLGEKTVLDFLRGAQEMDQHALEKKGRENLPLLAALLGLWNRNFLGYPSVSIVPYSHALSRFVAHLQQCDMESNGKSVTRSGEFVDYETGPFIWGEPGTNSQHSFFQFLHQGTEGAPVEFIGFSKSQYGRGEALQQELLASLFSQALALAQGQKEENPNRFFPGNRPSSLLLGKQLTPYAMGSLLAYYEHKIAFQGFLWDINSFDQEGVQLGKRLAKRILQAVDSTTEECFPLGEALWQQRM